MRNVKLIIEYDGTAYHGWQIQPELTTIQGVIESKLSIITKADMAVTGAGRTDAGVHALGQVANFRTESGMTPEQFKLALNRALPRDIVIRRAQEVDDDFHSRFSAVSRTYRYTILNEKTPSAFLRNYTYRVRDSINVDSMSEACKILLGEHDFSSFASTGDPVKNFVRTVNNASVTEVEGAHKDAFLSIPLQQYRLIQFQIEANAFLRSMVRAIIGTLLEIGRGKMPPEKMRNILEAKDRSVAGPNLPAKGLCLMEVGY